MNTNKLLYNCTEMLYPDFPWHILEVRNTNSKRDLTKLYTMSLAFHLFLWNEYLAFSHFRCFCNLRNTDWSAPISQKLT